MCRLENYLDGCSSYDASPRYRLYVHPSWPQHTMAPRRASDVEDPSAGLIPSRQAAGSSPAAGLPSFPRGPVEDISVVADF